MVCEILSMKTAWLRLDSEFMLVAATVRDLLPSFKITSMSYVNFDFRIDNVEKF